MSNANTDAWVQALGVPAQDLCLDLEQVLKTKLTSGKLSSSEIGRVTKLDLSVSNAELNLPDQQLEKLRRMCQIWDVDIRLTHLSSHRPWLGPLIVMAKKLVLPFLKLFLRDTLRQQRDFNAASLALMVDLCAERSRSPNVNQIK